MTNFDLLPLQKREIECPLAWDAFISRLRGVVQTDTVLFVNYRRDKGKFAGKVTERKLLVKRVIRRPWVPTVLGYLYRETGHCRIKLWFFAPEASVFALFILLSALVGMWRYGVGGLIFGAVLTGYHVVACANFRSEVEFFMQELDRHLGETTSGNQDK